MLKDLLHSLFPLMFLLFFLPLCGFSSEPAIKINNTSVREVASQFENPPAEYSLTFYWGWDGNVTKEVMARDLDEFKSKNVQVVTLEPGYNMPNPYLSAGWFEDVKTAVSLAKERNMKLYLVDEGKYPSGFAGGKIASETPDLRMKVLAPDTVITLKQGEKLSIKLSDKIISAAAFNKITGESRVLEINNRILNWSAPEGEWQITLLKHVIQSSPTRSVNNPSGGKDSRHALIDYLDSKATNKFIEFTHENYKKYMGTEFGTTILGFRGDEPDYSTRGIPWTPNILSEFEKHKGYSVQPFLATFLSPTLTDEQKRVKADYWDVWSTLFADNFFKVQSDWCAANNLKYLVHLNHEENMTGLVRSEGDFYKDLRSVQMPGVDVIWHQIWPGEVNPIFPKYASSSSHLNGNPRSFTESFAAFRPQPDIKQAKWILDQQFVRGINMVEIMFVGASSKGESGMKGWFADQNFPELAKYIQRSSFLLSQGIPAASIAVLLPTTSIWLGANQTDSLTQNIMQGLLKMQHDFDVIDEYSIEYQMTIQNGSFINKSGQNYSAIIIPPVKSISKNVITRLKEFENSGGKVISVGNKSVLAVDKAFKNAPNVEFKWAINEPSEKLTNTILAALPVSDLKLEKPCEDIKYVHRRLKEADLYFIFNEGDKKQGFNVTLAGKGKVQIWDARSGKITESLVKAIGNESIETHLNLEPWETKFIVVGKK